MMEEVLRTNLKSKQLLILLQRIFSHPILLISQAAIFLFRFHFDLLNRSKLFKIRNEKKLIPDALKRLSKQWQQVVQVTTSLRESLATNLDNTLN